MYQNITSIDHFPVLLSRDEDGYPNTVKSHVTCHSHHLKVKIHLMRLWYFSFSVNSFFKRTCAAIKCG